MVKNSEEETGEEIRKLQLGKSKDNSEIYRLNPLIDSNEI